MEVTIFNMAKNGAVNKIQRFIQDQEDACEGGHIAESMLSCLNSGLEGACSSGNIDIVKLMISKGANDLDRGLYSACSSGNKNIAELLLSKNADAKCGFWGACKSGNIDLAKLMIDTNSITEYSLYSACYSGNIDLVNLVISKGSVDWNGGLIGACAGKHLEIAKLMISKGATAFNDSAFIKNIQNIYERSPEDFKLYKKKLQNYFYLKDFQEILLNLSCRGNLGRITARGLIIARVIEIAAA